MASIISGIMSLAQYLLTLNENPKQCNLETCPLCGMLGLWKHGFYYRKADRENTRQNSLNPVPVSRFFCPSCRHTCSLLPECVPPLRWYLWSVQQAALLYFISGLGPTKISNKILPSRWTVGRWMARFKNQFELHALHFKSKWPWSGYNSSFNEFWPALLNKLNLSCAMLFLNSAGVAVP